jgi:D-alanine-D-alanine ligase
MTNIPHQKRALLLHNDVAGCTPKDISEVMEGVRDIAATLKKLGYRVTCLPVPADLDDLRDELLLWQPPAVVFNYVEWFANSDMNSGRVIDVLQECGVIYTGCPAWAHDHTNHKLKAKHILLKTKLATAPLYSRKAKPHKPMSWIVKCATENASFALDDSAIVKAHADVGKAIAARRKKFGRTWFAEAFIAGREFHVSMLDGPKGVQVLPPVEIDFHAMPKGRPHILSAAAKFDPKAAEYDATPAIFRQKRGDKIIHQRMQKLALGCWKAFRLSGFARIDMRVDSKGKPWVLEVNANPDLSIDPGMDSGLSRAAYRTGLKFTDIIGRLIAAGEREHLIQQRKQKRSTTTRHSASIIRAA